MRAINHALTGSLIGLTVGEPAVALPLALASHFICDIIPHHAATDPTSPEWLGSARFRNVLITDALLCITLVVVLALDHPLHWLLAAICAFVATSPDMLNLRLFIDARSRGSVNITRLLKFTIGIQWFQRPIGAVVEAAWFI